MADLQLDLDDLSRLKATVDRVRDNFMRADPVSHDVADLCGHPGLAGKVREFADNWSIGREKLQENLHWTSEALKSIVDTFTDLDARLAAEAKKVGGEYAAAVAAGGAGAQPISAQSTGGVVGSGSGAGPGSGLSSTGGDGSGGQGASWSSSAPGWSPSVPSDGGSGSAPARLGAEQLVSPSPVGDPVPPIHANDAVTPRDADDPVPTLPGQGAGPDPIGPDHLASVEGPAASDSSGPLSTAPPTDPVLPLPTEPSDAGAWSGGGGAADPGAGLDVGGGFAGGDIGSGSSDLDASAASDPIPVLSGGPGASAAPEPDQLSAESAPEPSVDNGSAAHQVAAKQGDDEDSFVPSVVGAGIAAAGVGAAAAGVLGSRAPRAAMDERSDR